MLARSGRSRGGFDLNRRLNRLEKVTRGRKPTVAQHINTRTVTYDNLQFQRNQKLANVKSRKGMLKSSLSQFSRRLVTY